MKKWIFYSLLLLLVHSSLSTIGQQMLGTVFSNYGGINSAQINPALITGSRSYLDVNIVSVNSFFKNNWAYIPKNDKNVWEIIKMDTIIPIYGEYKYTGMYTYYDIINPKTFSQSTRVIGPSVMLQADQHAFGLGIQTRMQVSTKDIPYEIPIFIYEALTFDSLQDVVFDDYDFNFSSLTWSEIYASWGYDFQRLYKSKLSFGVNAKLLLGHEGAYSVNKNAKYIVYDPRNIEFYNYEAEYGIALPVDYNSKEPIYQNPLVKGYGLGLDLGFVFTRLKNRFPHRGGRKLCSKPYEEYLYRIGISVLDIGAITFKQNAQKHTFDKVSVYWAEFDTIKYHNLNTSIQQLSQAFYDDPNQSKTDDKISIGLPTTISLQFEGNFIKNFYIAALWVQPIQFNAKQVRQPSQASIIPRFENSLFALSLPVSLLEYEYLSLGAAVRVGPITVGTERLGVLLGVSDIDGVDIYFSLKFSLSKERCSTQNIGACYSWN